MLTTQGVTRRAVAYMAIVAAVTLVTWRDTLRVPFLLDDNHVVRDNLDIREMGNCGRFLATFPNRGLLKTGYALNYAIAQRGRKGAPSPEWR